ncbi:phage major capsid protein [Pseudonocardia tropica]|uniref:Phage major capsid protein n=1 Tax=Pseudonocardia tropica TaxID=681289 RepID=A0ABV1JT84_9PSEU
MSKTMDLFDSRVPAVDPGDIIGFTSLGEPIRAVAGSARATFESWIPIDFGSDVITKVRQTSAIEAYAQRVPMTTQTKSTPRSGGMGVSLVAKGAAYGEDTTANDEVILRVQKFGSVARIAEEDIDDSLANIIDTKTVDWATSYAKALDNACLGVSVARGTSLCAFDSVYYQLTQADAATGYTANSNITVSGTGGTTYDALSGVLGQAETGDYWDEAEMIVMAHPSFKKKFRGIKDSTGSPILQESSNGSPGGAQAPTADRLFGHQVHWTLGARKSTTVTSAPTGNPLLFIANRQLLLLGVRSGPETVLIDGKDGAAALTDESLLKMRSRRGFALGHPAAVSCFEDSTGV